MEQLTPLDNLFCLLEQPNAPMHIGALLILDQSTAPKGFLCHKELLEYIKDRLHLAKGFRRCIVDSPLGVDFPYAVADEHFDLEFHVRHMGLPTPGDWNQLCVLTGRIMSRPLDMQRPPWELYIIERLDNIEGIPENSFAVMLKIHHAIADGISATEMLNALLQFGPDEEPPQHHRPWVAERSPGKLEMWARAAPNIAGQLLRSGRDGYKALRATLKVRKALKEAGRYSLTVPRTRFNENLTPHRVFDAIEWPIAEAKALTELAPDSKINDVMVSVIAGAMRHYMLGLNELPELSLVAFCPISVRSKAAQKDGGNKVSGMRVEMGTHIADPIERMQFIQEQTALGKKVINANMADALESGLGAVPPFYGNILKGINTRFGLQSRIPPLANTLITNVQGPTLNNDLYLAGAKVVSCFGIPPLSHGFGFGHVVGNSTGRVNVSVSADRTMLSDTSVYIGCLQQSFDEHEQALSEARLIAAKREAARDKRRQGHKTIGKKSKARLKTVKAEKLEAS
ncbi:MAG: wax ester/triacylglycerol synthase family O-acyltransferase [Cellvibrionaceae bacterium]|nr:wax ester/triacylglycerol synthase family O-acyltransferase [Cellvibrionaceae bacterium]